MIYEYDSCFLVCNDQEVCSGKSFRKGLKTRKYSIENVIFMSGPLSSKVNYGSEVSPKNLKRVSIAKLHTV